MGTRTLPRDSSHVEKEGTQVGTYSVFLYFLVCQKKIRSDNSTLLGTITDYLYTFWYGYGQVPYTSFEAAYQVAAGSHLGPSNEVSLFVTEPKSMECHSLISFFLWTSFSRYL
jgi:hypothetical protein